METGRNDNIAQGTYLGITPGQDFHVHALGVIKNIFSDLGIGDQPGLVILLAVVGERFQGGTDIEKAGVGVKRDLDIGLGPRLIVEFALDEEVLTFYLASTSISWVTHLPFRVRPCRVR